MPKDPRPASGSGDTQPDTLDVVVAECKEDLQAIRDKLLPKKEGS